MGQKHGYMPSACSIIQMNSICIQLIKIQNVCMVAYFSVSSRFLCHTLPNTACMERVRELKDGGAMIIHAWLRCAWRRSASDAHMTELTR